VGFFFFFWGVFVVFFFFFFFFYVFFFFFCSCGGFWVFFLVVGRQGFSLLLFPWMEGIPPTCCVFSAAYCPVSSYFLSSAFLREFMAVLFSFF